MRGIQVKKYFKPELFYEVFELSQHIADCTWEWVNHIDPMALCYASADLDKVPFMTEQDKVFADFAICTHLREDIEDFCYQNSILNATLFNS